MSELRYVAEGPGSLDKVRELWEKLNQHQVERSVHFGEAFRRRDFGAKEREIRHKAHGGDVRVDLVYEEGGRPVGFCISLIDGLGTGEIESLYVEKAYRGRRIGEEFMRRALAWMDANNVAARRLTVAWGNEETYGFYERFGFLPRLAVLEQVQKRG